jgi:hypothetical protein
VPEHPPFRFGADFLESVSNGHIVKVTDEQRNEQKKEAYGLFLLCLEKFVTPCMGELARSVWKPLAVL